MLAVVLANTVTLALFNPLIAADDPFLWRLEVAGWVFLALFTAEAFLRIIAMGLVLHPDSYARDPWNVFDFIILVAGFVLTSFRS